MAERICPGFNRDAHPADEEAFYPDKNRRGGGFSRLCKECHRTRGKQYFNQTYYPAHAQELKDAVKRRREAAKSGEE